jgi:hypothetical protein
MEKHGTLPSRGQCGVRDGKRPGLPTGPTSSRLVIATTWKGLCGPYTAMLLRAVGRPTSVPAPFRRSSSHTARGQEPQDPREEVNQQLLASTCPDLPSLSPGNKHQVYLQSWGPNSGAMSRTSPQASSDGPGLFVLITCYEVWHRGRKKPTLCAQFHLFTESSHPYTRSQADELNIHRTLETPSGHKVLSNSYQLATLKENDRKTPFLGFPTQMERPT